MSRAKPRYTYIEAPVEASTPEAKPTPAQREKKAPQAKSALAGSPVPEAKGTPAQKEKSGTLGKAAPVTRPVEGSVADALINPAAYALPAQRRGKRDEEGVLRRTDVPREQLNVRIRPELKRAAAGMAAFSGKTLGDVVEMALIAYLESSKQNS